MTRAATREANRAIQEARITTLAARAWSLKVEGYRHEEIGQMIVPADGTPLSASRVGTLLKAAEQELSSTFILPGVLALKAEQLARYEYIYREAIGAWRKSKEPRRSGSKHQHTRNGNPQESTVQHAQEREGTPQYLDTAMRALESMRKLTGTDSPLQVHHVHGTDTTGVSDHVSTLDDAQLGPYLAQLAHAALLASGVVIEQAQPVDATRAEET